MAFIPCLYDEYECINIQDGMLMVRCQVTQLIDDGDYLLLDGSCHVYMIEAAAATQPRGERLREPLFAHLYEVCTTRM